MEPNKLENEIREKLGKREIQPSAQAWDRLDAMLSVQESKVEKKTFPWLRIAAGIVLFLGVSYFFINIDEEKIIKNNSNVVVNEDDDESSNNKSDVINEDVVDSNKLIVDKKSSSVAYSESKTKAEVQNKGNVKLNDFHSKVISSVETKDYQVAISEPKNESKNIEQKSDQKFIQDNKEVVADVKVSPEKPKLNIDPNSLLDQVDGEIQLTFRQKVMKTVKKGYKEAREAVVSRNQESSINH